MLQKIATIIASVVFILTLSIEPLFSVIFAMILWIAVTQDISKVTFNFKNVFKVLIWLAFFVLLVVLSTEIYEGIYFLLFFFINRFAMVSFTRKYMWLLSVGVFSLLCFFIPVLSIFILSGYWYFFYRHHEILEASQQKNITLELGYYFCILGTITSIIFYFPLGFALFFGALAYLAFQQRKNAIVAEPLDQIATEKASTLKAENQNNEEEPILLQEVIEEGTEERPILLQEVTEKDKEVKESAIWKNFASFLQKNIGNLLLLLGVLFLLTGLVTFLRSNWEQFKYIIFVCYVLVTVTLFCFSYYLFAKKKQLIKLSFVCSLLATLFFPFTFYFAVKIGLLPDHGNKYTVLWMTTALALLHMYMYRSGIFTIFSTVLMIVSTGATLQKFLAPYYEMYAIFFAFLALISFFIHFSVKEDPKRKWIFVIASNLCFLIATLLAVAFWQTYIFLGVMLCGVAFFTLQIRTTYTYWNAYFYGMFFALTSLGTVVTAFYATEISIFTLGIPTVAFSFLLLHIKTEKCEVQKAMRHVGIWTPLVMFVLFLHYGAYSSYHGQWSVFACAIISSLGYMSSNRFLQQSELSYLALMFHLLSIAEILSIYELSSHLYSCIFLTWATCAAWLSSKEKVYSWLQKPLQNCSLWIMPLVLVYVIVLGNDFYRNHFLVMCITLLMTSAFCIYTAILLSRKDLATIGIGVFISLCTLVQSYHSYSFHYLAMFIIACCTISQYILRKFKLLQKETSADIFFIPVILAFSIASFCMGLGQQFWQVHVVLLMSFVFFGWKYHSSENTYYFWGILTYLSLYFFTLTCNGQSFLDWGIYFSILGIIFTLLQKRLPIDTTKMIEKYCSFLFIACLCEFVVFFRSYYSETFWFPLLLTIFCFSLYKNNNLSFLRYVFFANLYTFYFFLLPANLFTFQYALFYIPVAIAIFAMHKKLPQVWKQTAWQISHATVLFFLLLPAILPGMVPSAMISLWVIAMAFVFYFTCLYYEQKPMYSYISTILLSACILTALFASKSLWGTQIAMSMALGSLLICLGGVYLLKKKSLSVAAPIFHVIAINILLVAFSFIFIGKIDYSTLISLFVCSCIAAIISFYQMAFWKLNNTFTYLSIALFSIAYYLSIEKIDLHALNSGILVISLACISAFMAKIFDKIPSFHNSFLFVTAVVPAMSLVHAHSSIHITILMILSSVLYMAMALHHRHSFFGLLGLIALSATIYSFNAYMAFDYSSIVLISTLWGIILLYSSQFLPKKYISYAKKSFIKIGYANQVLALSLCLWNSSLSAYFVASLALINSCAIFVLYTKSHQYLVLASASFAFSYYTIVLSWATSVWEFYSVPLGIALIAYAYFLKAKKEFAYYRDVAFIGLLCIFIPTLIQSYHGWFDHLYDIGTSPYHHLYHSFFLILESMVILLLGAYRKNLLFFFTGITFLLADVTLVLFAYVHLGTIPQAIWWAGLGSLLIGSWIVIEYKKEWLLSCKDYMISAKNKWQSNLKSWN